MTAYQFQSLEETQPHNWELVVSNPLGDPIILKWFKQAPRADMELRADIIIQRLNAEYGGKRAKPSSHWQKLAPEEKRRRQIEQLKRRDAAGRTIKRAEPCLKARR